MLAKYTRPFEEQWARILRLRKGLDVFAIADGSNFENAVDAFTSFYIQCYHLRDWLIESGFTLAIIDHYINRNDWLVLCRELANKQKHQKISRGTPKNTFVDFEVGVSTPITKYFDPIKKQARFGIDVWELRMPVDTIEVADKCVGAWSDFIKNNDPTHMPQNHQNQCRRKPLVTPLHIWH